MQVETHEYLWLHAPGTVSQSELARMCRIAEDELEELIEYGLLVPLGGAPHARVFDAGCVQPLREAGTMRDRFDLDLFVLGLMFSQLERIASLEQQVRSLQAHRPRR
jgi:chaperone modulatory protein CbpM